MAITAAQRLARKNFNKQFSTTAFDNKDRDNLYKAFGDLSTQVANLNAWATALATKLNAQFTAANAETTLPFSPALAVDYDTNPQA